MPAPPTFSSQQQPRLDLSQPRRHRPHSPAPPTTTRCCTASNQGTLSAGTVGTFTSAGSPFYVIPDQCDRTPGTVTMAGRDKPAPRRTEPASINSSNNTHQPTAHNPPPPRPYPMNSSRHFFDTTRTARTAPTSSSRPGSTSSSAQNPDLNSIRILPTRQNDSWGERAEDSGGGGWKEVAGRRRNEGAGQVTADSGRAAPEDDTDGTGEYRPARARAAAPAGFHYQPGPGAVHGAYHQRSYTRPGHTHWRH